MCIIVLPARVFWDGVQFIIGLIIPFYVTFSVFEKQRTKRRISIDLTSRSLLRSHFFKNREPNREFPLLFRD